jgi:hypothetical protein
VPEESEPEVQGLSIGGFSADAILLDPALFMRPPAALIGAAWAELSEETRPCSEREVRRLLAIWKVPRREPVVGESQQHPSLVFDRGCSTLGGPVEGAGGAAATAVLMRDMSKLRSRLRVGFMVVLPTYLDFVFSQVMSENSLWPSQ